MKRDRSRLEALPQQFPRVFGGDSIRQIEHDTGWTDLLTALLTKIDHILQSDPDAVMVVSQIKEKYGELHFYYQLFNAQEATHEAIETTVDNACDSSLKVCERCGNLGSLSDEQRIVSVRCEQRRNIADALAMPDIADIEFVPPRVTIESRPVDFS